MEQSSLRKILAVQMAFLLAFSGTPAGQQETSYIKWVDFQVSKMALEEAYEYDVDTYGTDAHISWIDLLAWTAAHTGGAFDQDRKVYQWMTQLEEEREKGSELKDLTEDLKYFSYYQEA